MVLTHLFFTLSVNLPRGSCRSCCCENGLRRQARRNNSMIGSGLQSPADILRCGQERTSDRPHEGSEFPSNRGDHRISVFAPAHKFPVTATESKLCLPGDIPYLLGETVQAGQKGSSFPRRMTVGMCRFDQHLPHMAIAGFGDASPFGGASAGMLAGDKTQVSHYLFRRVKTGQVAATTRETPRRDCRAFTSRAMSHCGINSWICWVSR